MSEIESRKTVLARLPEKAVRAWENGGTWNREYPEGGSWIEDVTAPLHREVADTWERRSIESRITVTRGALIERFYSVDARGARTLRRAPKWGSDRHRSVREKFSPGEKRQRWAEYWEWVAETGRDPIGEFSVPATARCGWRLMCREKEERVFVLYARRLESARPLKRSTDYLSRSRMPHVLRDHCFLEGGVIYPEAINSRSDLAHHLRRRGTGQVAGRQILDSELRRVPDDERGPLETFPEVFFADVTVEEQISQGRQRKILQMKAKENLGQEDISESMSDRSPPTEISMIDDREEPNRFSLPDVLDWS